MKFELQRIPLCGMRYSWFLFFAFLFFSREPVAGASYSTVIDIHLIGADSSKTTVKTTAQKPVSPNKQKAEDDTPISFDFAKKKMKLNLFGNKIDIDFKKRDMEINKNKSEESSWLDDIF